MADNEPFQDLLLITAVMLLLLAGAAATWKWVSDRQPVSADQSAAIAEQGEAMTQLLQEQLTEELASQPLSEEQERIDSPMGQALLRKCIEWTSFHDNHPDASTLQNRDAACDEYSEFVESGVAPQ